MGNNEGIDSFTIEVRSLPSAMTMAELKATLWNHFSSVSWQFFLSNNPKLTVKNGKKVQTIQINVVDVQLAESNTLLALNAKLGVLKEKVLSLTFGQTNQKIESQSL